MLDRTAAETGTAGVRLGVVSPMANEAETAIEFVDAVLGACQGWGFTSVRLFAILDQVSTDETRTLLESHAKQTPLLRVVWAPATRGVADAYIRGYREALAADCDWILEIDAGFSHDPSQIERLLTAMSPDRDCVFGSRFLDGGANHGGLKRRAVSRGGTVLANMLLGTRLTDMTGGFELFTRETLLMVLAKGIRSKGPFFQTEIKAHCRGLRVAEVPIDYGAGSHPLGTSVFRESLVNLLRLFGRRITGTL